MAAAVSMESIHTDPDPTFRIEELLNPDVYAHPVTELKLRESPLSWVIRTGIYAYKVKKCLKLDFLDTTALASRRFFCDEELRLNRRLAPELYLDVIAIARAADGVHMGGAGSIVDYAVRMKQFEESEELPALLARGAVGMDEVRALAEQLADFHRRAPVATDDKAFDYLAQLRKTVLGNEVTLVAHLDSLQQFPTMALLIHWTRDSLHDFAERFRRRQADGFIRECHGDLHAHNIVRWHRELTPFDCLEFDPALRWIDVMNDVAFLFMDLAVHGRKDLGYGFLSHYVERTSDYEGIRLLPFYAVYRALVRAMVDTLEAEQHGSKHLDLYKRIHARINTAMDFIHPTGPSLFIMHGPSGSGKSWLSEQLVPLIGAVRMRSDFERKRLAGFETMHSVSVTASQTLYAPEAILHTYSVLLEYAESCLLGGISVIVDAAFLDVESRRLFRTLAERLDAQFVIISCFADEAEMARRIKCRRLSPAEPSDATVAVLESQLGALEPPRADEEAHVIRVDTAKPNAASAAFAILQAREANLAQRTVALR